MTVLTKSSRTGAKLDLDSWAREAMATKTTSFPTFPPGQGYGTTHFEHGRTWEYVEPGVEINRRLRRGRHWRVCCMGRRDRQAPAD